MPINPKPGETYRVGAMLVVIHEIDPDGKTVVVKLGRGSMLRVAIEMLEPIEDEPLEDGASSEGSLP